MSQQLARITSMFLQPDSVQAAFDYFRDVSTPAVRRQAGSIGILGAGSRESGFGMAISFWETLEHLERSNAEPRVVEALGGYAKWMVGPFKVESYSVVSGEIPLPDAGDFVGTHMRLTQIASVSGWREDVVAEYSRRIAHLRETAPACVAAFLLAPTIGNQLLLMELWSSPSALNTWDAASKPDDQRLFRAGCVEQPPTREILEVFGYF